MAATIQAENLYSYQSDALGVRTILGCAVDGSGLASISNVTGYWDASGNFQTIFTPSVLASNLRAAYSRDYMYFSDGVEADLLKWNISTGVSTWGIVAPVVGPTLGVPTSGLITLLTGRVYYLVYEDGTSINYSDISPASAITGPLTNQKQPLTGLSVSSQSNVTLKTILATADGGDPSVLYFVASIPNSQTTYTDNTPEITLLLNPVYQYTDSAGVPHGVVGNQPPPNGSYPTKHNGRLWMLIGQSLYFSKSLDEMVTSTGFIAGRYEESWPPGNVIDISEAAEQGTSLLSFQSTMFIGTYDGVHSFLGDSATNFTEPAVVFENTGVMTQNCWQIVFEEETPVGAMWVTPDFRCLGSDYNTYQNVGLPIQNTLNTINPNAINACFAVSVQQGAFNFYVLAIATGSNLIPDTLCVFETHLKKWYIWKCADTFLSGIYYVSLFGTPRWIMCDSTGTIRNFSPAYVQDRNTDANATPITSSLKSAWLQMGDPLTRKSLNEMELITTIPIAQITVGVQGATQEVVFQSPNILVSGVIPITNVYGDVKVPLAGTFAVDKNYQYTISMTSSSSSSPSDILLSEVAFEVCPLNRI